MLVIEKQIMNRRFYPEGKHAAVVVSIDDVRPGISTRTSGDGSGFPGGILAAIIALRQNHPQLTITLFTVPDCREKNPFPTRRWLSHIPVLNRYFYLSPIWPDSTLSLEKHPEFCQRLGTLPGVEIAVHGLHHVSKGQPVFQEFRQLSLKECMRRLERAEGIFERVKLSYVKGFAPPGWNISPPLLRALQIRKYKFLASARDLQTEITIGAVTNGSGMHNLPLLYPTMLPGTDIIHIPANWSRTSSFERADRILELGGVLSIKGHAVKQQYGYTAVDGIDEAYCHYLDALFNHIEKRWGGDIWWTSMGDLSAYYRGNL
jgi:peptidoglycan/xylan/chitin deacetylase (PgdA/CDA1 family)